VARAALLAAAMVFTGGACSSSSKGTTTSASAPCSATTVAGAPVSTAVLGGASTVLRIADVPAAVAAVEKARGGAQRYTEINTTTGGVNVFVAVAGGQEISYFFDSCGLSAPGVATTADGTVFDLTGVKLPVATTLLAKVQDKLPGAIVEGFALVDLAPDGVVWAVKARVAKGGLVNLRYSPAGDLIAATDGGG
jgi:hypothetical protein